MGKNLGTIGFSDKLLSRASSGFWALEFDEGKEPRLYVDEAMLDSLGIVEPGVPEKTYLDWYVNIDESYRSLVSATLEKAVTGIYSEVQFQWNNPVGSKAQLRCSGIRNETYLAGIRVEGIVWNATNVLQMNHEIYETERKRVEEEQRAAREEAAKETNLLMGGFTGRYASVYRVNVETGRYTALKSIETITDLYKKSEDFRANLNSYIDGSVYEPDKDKLRRRMDLSKIYAQTQESGSFSIEYRACIDGIPLWHEMTSSIIGEGELLIGFTEDDENILARQISRILQRAYEAVYVINLNTDQLKVVKAAGFLKGKATVVPYRETMLKFAAGLQDDARTYFERSADSAQEKQALKAEGRREFLYISPHYEEGPTWIKMETYVLTWKSGEPETIVTVTMKADAQQREKLELDRKIAEQNQQLSEQRETLEKALSVSQFFLNTFVSAYYLNLRDKTYVVMKRTEELDRDYPLDHSYQVSLREYIETGVHPDDREMMRRAVETDYIRERIEKEGTYSLIFRDIRGGMVKYYRYLVIPGATPDYAGFGFLDVTKDVNKDEELLILNRSTQLLTGSIHQLYPLIAVLNLTKNTYSMLENDRFTSHEASAAGTADELIEAEVQTIPNREQAKTFRKMMNRQALISAYQSGKRLVSLRHQKADDNGKTHWVTTVCILSEIEGELMAASLSRAVDQEVADERHYQEMLETALARAEVASKAKSTFLFNMSHDIRTPMNAIIGFTTMAKNHYDDRQRVQDCLDKIEISGHQLLLLINQILEMSRIESGKVVLTEEPIDLVEKVYALQTVVDADVANKNLHYSINIGKVENRRVLADNSRLNQLFINIIGNAVKYTPEGGSITFSLAEEVGDRPGHGMYRFTVADTGIGMSEEFLKHVFDEFSRESTSTVSNIQGTGLGMSIVKRLVDLMGGDIDITSKQGCGTTIAITLPLKWNTGAEDAGKPVVEKKTVSLQGKRILLVEDNEMNREIALDILDEHGVITDTAENGSVALEKVRNAEPGDYDIILMDIQMPVMNGYEATKQIRQLRNGMQKVPIIAMTANAFEEDRRNAIAAGMDDHLAKPIDINKLTETLARHAD